MDHLKLIMLQGPREGETLEFRFGSTVRIGRVVRGNNVTIKDVGISSKHLIIESVPESNKWILTDLDSSNGTLLNSSKLPPNTPFHLKDGDTVKLGELTSIMVKIDDGGGEGLVHSRPRRNPGRSANAGNVKREKETVEMENGAKLDQGGGGGGGGGKGSSGEANEESRIERNPRRPVNGKNVTIEVEAEGGEGLQDDGSLEMKKKMPRGRPPRHGERVVRVTRSRSQKGEVMLIDVEKTEEEGNKARGGAGGRGRGRGRGKGRNLRGKEENVTEELHVEVVEPVNVKKGMQVEIGESEGADNKDKNGAGENGVEYGYNAQGRRRKNLNREQVKIEIIEDEGNDKDDDDKEVAASQEKVDDGGDCEVGGSDGKAEGSKGLDLERMTLGQWFDYLEVNLPKQIIEETEEMIEGMRRKADRVKEYMVEQKMKEKEKGKVPVMD